MTRPSRRYVPPAVILLLLAALPVWSGRLDPGHDDPCSDPHALRDLEQIPGTRARDERVEHLTSDLFQWSEGALLDDDAEPTPLRVHVIRDFDGRRFFARPFALGGDLEPESVGTRRVETEDGAIFLHWAVDKTTTLTAGVQSFAVYTFLYGNRPARSAVAQKLRHAVDELRNGRRPVTFLMVKGAVPADRLDELLTRSEGWLQDAVERHRRVCGKA